MLIGIGKWGQYGRVISLDVDASLIVMAGVLRKLVFKTTFLMDKMSIQARLVPHQMVVGAKAGAESMIHTGRTWVNENRHRRNYVLLQWDVSNTYNKLHPHEFLDDYYSYAPVSSKFAEY